MTVSVNWIGGFVIGRIYSADVLIGQGRSKPPPRRTNAMRAGYEDPWLSIRDFRLIISLSGFRGFRPKLINSVRILIGSYW